MKNALKALFACALAVVVTFGWLNLTAEPAEALQTCPSFACQSLNGYAFVAMCDLYQNGELSRQCELWACPVTSGGCYTNCGGRI